MKSALRMFALLGAALLGMWLFRSSPHDVILVYDLGSLRDARSLKVRIEHDGDLLRRVEFLAPQAQVRHEVKLTDGTYHLKYDIAGPGLALSGDRQIQVSESQTIVLSLGP